MSLATASDEKTHLISLIESRGAASEVGVAVFNLTTSVCILSQYADTAGYSRTLHLLSVYPPELIILCESAAKGSSPCKLYLALQDLDKDFDFVQLHRHDMQYRVVTAIRKEFNEANGMACIENFCIYEELGNLGIGLLKKQIPLREPFNVSIRYYCLAATSALFRYLEIKSKVTFPPNSIVFRQQSCQGTMFIDCYSAKNLELVANIAGSPLKNSLYACLDRCETKMGSRLVRMNVLQPPVDIEIIAARHECVAELLASESWGIKKELAEVPDLDLLITRIIRRPSKNASLCHIEHVIQLKKILDVCVVLESRLNNLKHQVFRTIRENVSSELLQELHGEVKELLNEDLEQAKIAQIPQHKRCYAVKAGQNGLLDVARKTLRETTDDICEYVTALASNTSLSLSTSYSPKRGFYISASKEIASSDSAVPDCFILLEKSRGNLWLTTMDMLKYNERISESLTEIYLLSDKIIDKFLDKVRANIGQMHYASEAIAFLDFLLSMADYASSQNSVCPEFGQVLAIKAGRHPVLDKQEVVPNDVYSAPGHNFHVITGANMSGKSTYLRQIALLQIMAQIGFHVPCEYASFRIADQIFTRLGSDDDLESNCSTFFVEMREAAYILASLNDSSLVIIDELGRGTSTSQGLAITAAICEVLIKTKASAEAAVAIHAFVFFATHFQSLSRYLDSFPNSVLLHLSESSTFKVVPGPLLVDNYGLRLAQQCGFPSELMDSAYGVSKKVYSIANWFLRISQLSESQETLAESNALDHRIAKRKLIFRTAEKVKQVKRAGRDKEALSMVLSTIRDEFLEELEKIASK